MTQDADRDNEDGLGFHFHGHAATCFICGRQTSEKEEGNLWLLITAVPDYGGWICHQECVLPLKHPAAAGLYRFRDGGEYHAAGGEYHAATCFICGRPASEKEEGNLELRITAGPDHGGWICHEECVLPLKHPAAAGFYRFVFRSE